MYLSKNTLNVNRLSIPIKRYRVLNNKTRVIHMLPTRNSTSNLKTHRIKVKEWKNVFHANKNEKKLR